MKRKLGFLGLGLAIIAVGWLVQLRQPVQAAIVNTRHDFTNTAVYTWGNGEICKPCHTPHNAITTISDAPLWAHNVTTFASFTPYTSSTLQATVGQPSNQSRLCLSCHDGTVALGAYIGGPGGSTYINTAHPNAHVGTDLSNDHPISFTYNSALATADGELRDPSSLNANLVLFANRMECATCHDPHGRQGVPKLLVMNNTGSALCLACHIK